MIGGMSVEEEGMNEEEEIEMVIEEVEQEVEEEVTMAIVEEAMAEEAIMADRNCNNARVG